jgi:hypothetical protein
MWVLAIDVLLDLCNVQKRQQITIKTYSLITQ